MDISHRSVIFNCVANIMKNGNQSKIANVAEPVKAYKFHSILYM